MQILDFIRFTVFKWYIINQNSVILVSEQCQHFAPGYYVILFYHTKLRETFPYSEFFCSVFSRIRTEYEEIQGISPYLVRMRGNTVQKNSEYGQFSHKTILYFFFFFFILNVSLHYHKAIQCFANRIRRILSVIPTKNGSNLLYCFLHIFNNVRH